MSAVPVNPATKELKIIDNSDNVTNLVERVRTFDGDVKRFEEHIKTLKEQIEELVEQTPIYQQVEELSEKLKRLKEELKRELSSVAGYNNLLEELAEEQEALKDAKANISDFLLGYFAETKERQIELNDHDSREVKLKATLGKEVDYQTSMFKGDRDGR